MGNVEILKDAYEAFGHGDIPSVLATFDPNIEWREAEGNPYKPDGEPWIGSDAVTQNLFMKLGSEWDGFTVTPKEFHDAGDTIAVECRYTGVHNATGKSLNAHAKARKGWLRLATRSDTGVESKTSAPLPASQQEFTAVPKGGLMDEEVLRPVIGGDEA
jgi:uncharacterized protein